jgi:hypothetical protein
LADLRAEIHLWTGDESTPVDLRVLRAAAEEITALRARVAELEAALRFIEPSLPVLASVLRGAGLMSGSAKASEMLDAARRALGADHG